MIIFWSYFYTSACTVCTLDSIWAPVGQTPQQSPPLDDYDDYVNDDNDDEDDDIWNCLLLSWSVRKSWRGEPRLLISRYVTLTSFSAAIPDYSKSFYFTRPHKKNQTPWELPWCVCVCAFPHWLWGSVSCPNRPLGGAMIQYVPSSLSAESFLICHQFIFIQTKGDHVKNITSVDSL